MKTLWCLVAILLGVTVAGIILIHGQQRNANMLTMILETKKVLSDVDESFVAEMNHPSTDISEKTVKKYREILDTYSMIYVGVKEGAFPSDYTSKIKDSFCNSINRPGAILIWNGEAGMGADNTIHTEMKNAWCKTL